MPETKTVRILAVDPGLDTGWAEGEITDGGLHVIRHGWTKWKPWARALHDKLTQDEQKPYDVIVYETWKLTSQGAKTLLGSDMQSSQCIGCIWLAWDRSPHTIKLANQAPAIKNTIDKWMGGTGYLPSSDVEHNRDALRHLYYYAYNPKNETGLEIPGE